MEGLDQECLTHIKATGMDAKKYKKIATFVDKILSAQRQQSSDKLPSEDVLLKQFAAKCYKSFPEADGIRQARKFLKVLFGDDLSILVTSGANKALKSAAAGAPEITRIVRLNRPIDGFTKKLDKYLVGETLGKGATSKVKLGRNEETGQECALKILTGGNFSQEDLQKEIGILMKLNHPNVIRVFDYFDNVEALGSGNASRTTTVIVLELATKGEFFDFFMYTGHFEAPLARWFFKQMLEGLAYCHDNGIAHRDLKPENCLLGDGYTVKLVDFGFATGFHSSTGAENKMLTALGTPGYAAPEILQRKKYTKAVDIFSLGVILFITIAGFPPFQEAKPESDWWFHKLKTKRYDLFWKAHERTATFSDEAKEVLVGMLAAKPDERWTVDKIQKSAWYKQKTFSQEEAIVALEERKKKVVAEKIAAGKSEPKMDTHRGDDTISAPPMGTYRPANMFYCAPGKCADDIRALVMNAVGQMAMGNVTKLFEGTDSPEAPACPEGVDAEEWRPWWDISFSCTLKEGEQAAKPDGPPPKVYNFLGAVYIREDAAYKAPAEHPDWKRNIVYFKRHGGLAHKWMKVIFKIQNMVGYLHVQPSGLPEASPMKTIEPQVQIESKVDDEDPRYTAPTLDF